MDESLTVQSSVTSPVIDGLKDVLFGSIAGCTGKLIEYPFDTIKVRLQSQRHDQPLRFNGTWDCIHKTFTQEGLIGFYKGLPSPMVGAGLEAATLFLSYNMAQGSLKSILDLKELELRHLVACGAISGGFASFVLTPVELIKCKLQVGNLYAADGHSITITGLIKKIYLKEGLKGFWFGQTGTLLRECGGSASWFGVYELMTRFLKTQRLGRATTSKDENTTAELLASGASAGIAYNLSLFPADTIKSKMQTFSITNPGEGSLDFKGAFNLIYKHGGVKAFYNGLGITLIRAIPANAVIFFTYEKLKTIF
ncbi:hypothetical protein WICPIJ_000032 [Wickerhamomyces pijperi]|uniref:Mitochondrial ornithine carrier protein n=1 Tax=Wickerhamomyces pijperi TaxID=599730 RepID=A0A9P8QDI9_WICPI|nr:hypothetical protein WICPIJ_000032 [Wickerhamomyces pijperi]